MKHVLFTLLILSIFSNSSYAAWCVYAQIPDEDFKTVYQKCIGNEGSAIPLLEDVDAYIQETTVFSELCITWDAELDSEFSEETVSSKSCVHSSKPGITITFESY